MKNDEKNLFNRTLSPQNKVHEYKDIKIDLNCMVEGKVKTTKIDSHDTRMVQVEDIINVIKNFKNEPDETIDNLKKVDIKAYRKKYTSVWHGDNVNEVLRKFQSGFKHFEWRHGEFFHVVLKVNYKENSKPIEVDRNVSKNFGRLITSISNGKKGLDLKYYQAIKEFDELRDGETYQTPHLHLYIQISGCSMNKVKERITHYWENLWKVGKVNVEKISSSDHYENTIFYNTTMEGRKPEKITQMKLPDEYMDSSSLRRVYYPTKKTIDKLKKGMSFSYYILFRNELNKSSVKSMLEKLKNSRSTLIRSDAKSKKPQRVQSRRYKKRKTYREKTENDTSTLRISIPSILKEMYFETSIPMSVIKTMGGYYDDKKAYCLTLSDQDFERLKVLDKLHAAKIEEERRQDKLRRDFLTTG